MTHTLLALAGALVPWTYVPTGVVSLELLDQGALSSSMQRLVSEHAEFVELLPVGSSRAGVKIEALRIAAGEASAGRPAILLVANVDGPYVYTSSLALHHARGLVEGYGQDERITALLDSTTVYVIPRANPDGAAARFQSPLLELERTGVGVDDDRDGRSGEDDRSDVNDDGFVTWMRVPDPEGEWVEDPTEPRILIQAEREKGQRGTWKLVPEGRDSDGDEEVAEDPPRDANVNRNFGHAWKEHSPEAGRYPTHEPETLALCEFVLQHRDIALVLTYGEQGNLVGTPKVAASGGRRGDEPTGFLEQDVKLLEELGDRYTELTENETEGQAQTAGSFQAWCYHHRGLLTLDVAAWSVPEEQPKAEQDAGEEAGEESESIEELPVDEGAAEEVAEEAEHEEQGEEQPEPSDEAKQLRWLEAEGVSPVFIEWTAFEHPELGPVEIGGFVPYVRIEPPAEAWEAIADSHLEFLVSLGESLARVALVEVRAKRLSDGLVEVSAAVENDSLLPLVTQAGSSTRSARYARVRIELPDGATMLGGEIQTLVRQLAGAGGRRELRWLVKTSDPTSIRITVDTDHAGAAAANPELD